MKLAIKTEGINDEAIKVLTKAVKRLYKPYEEHYYNDIQNDLDLLFSQEDD